MDAVAYKKEHHHITDTVDECTELYEKMLFLLKATKEGMRTTEELIAEVEATKLHPETKDLFIKMLKVTEVEKLSKDERMEYEAVLKKYRDTMSQIEYARKKGEEKGREEGKEEGLQQGANERTLEIAKSLKDGGMPTAFIIQHTGLSEKEIELL